MPADTHASLAYPAGDDAILGLLQGLLRRTHLSTPSDIPAVIADQARCIGARDVALYLIDYDLSMLVPLPGGAAGSGAPLSVPGTVAGRAFASTTILRAQGEAPGQSRVWLPLLDGTERLGVMGMSFDEQALSDRIVAACERYAHLVAVLAALLGTRLFEPDIARSKRGEPPTGARARIESWFWDKLAVYL